MGPIKFADTAKTYGIRLSLKEARRVALLWRKNNEAIAGGWAYVKDAEGYEDGRFIDRVPGIWHKLEDACRDAVRDTGIVYPAGAFLKVAATKTCLMVQLPSGRAIRYWQPSVKTLKKKIQTVDEDGEIVEKEVEMQELQFFTPGKDAVSMVPESTYGGKLVENITQAVARDLLAHAVLLLDDRYPVVIHVHDSIASEVPAGFGSVEEFCSIMSTVPSWAPGLPLAASGYRDTRFRG